VPFIVVTVFVHHLFVVYHHQPGVSTASHLCVANKLENVAKPHGVDAAVTPISDDLFVLLLPTELASVEAEIEKMAPPDLGSTSAPGRRGRFVREIEAVGRAVLAHRMWHRFQRRSVWRRFQRRSARLHHRP
jgi:hypothetical protein